MRLINLNTKANDRICIQVDGKKRGLIIENTDLNEKEFLSNIQPSSYVIDLQNKRLYIGYVISRLINILTE